MEEGLEERASLLKGFRELDLVLCLCPPLFFKNTWHVSCIWYQQYEPRHSLKPSRSCSDDNSRMMKMPPVRVQQQEGRGAKVSSAMMGGNPLKRWMLKGNARDTADVQLLPLLVARILYLVLWGVLYYPLRALFFLGSVAFTFIVFLMLKQVVSCGGMHQNRSPSCCWWL